MLAAAIAALILLLVGWVVYPLVLTLVASRRRVGGGPVTSPPRDVSVVIATRDDPALVKSRVQNIQASDYPTGRIEVVVAVDAGARHPLGEYERAVGPGVRLVAGDPPGGKALTLNAGVRSAAGEIVVFADSHQHFAPDAIRALVRYLEDPDFGAVSGALAMTEGEAGSAVLDRFWEYEVMIRRAEAAVHSIVAVTGAVYAIRRELWAPLPAGLICDDLFVPINVAMAGKRVGFAEDARAWDPRRFTKDQEFSRKVRTLTGMLQLCAWRPSVLAPWRNPIWVQFVFHKLIRIVTPFLLVIGLIGIGAALIGAIGPEVWWAGVAVVAALGAAWLVRPAAMRRLATHTSWVLRFQTAPVVACLNAVRGRWDVWRQPDP